MISEMKNYPTRLINCVLRILLLIILLNACSTNLESISNNAIEPSETIKIAVLTPYGAQEKKLSYIGKSLRDAAFLAKQDLGNLNFQLKIYDNFVADEKIVKNFNNYFFSNGDSRDPELAGIGGALVGSFYSILICLLLSFPVAVLASIYLEEFAPKNKITDFIEININNLAAVPSIVYGLLALQILLATIQLPRSTPLVAGITLALMTLPRIIIPCRASLKAVPPSIREGALAVGASKFQSVFHHVVPLALPGTLSGTIIGLAQALGETAPLILIGMVAFVVDIPATPIDPSASLPVQVYLWSESAERGFVEKTSATIMMLLSFLIVMNFVAVYLRQKFEKRWN